MRKYILLLLVLSFTNSLFAENLDTKLFKSINGVRAPFLSGLETVSTSFIVVGPMAWSYMLFEGISKDSSLKIQKSIWCASGVISLVLANQLLKMSIHRTRPIFVVDGAKGGYKHDFETKILPSEKYSFPSQATSIAFFTAKYFGDEYGFKIPFYSMATIVAWGRIYKGAHYPGDVFGGAMLGYGMAWTTHYFQKKNISESTKLIILPQKNGLIVSGIF